MKITPNARSSRPNIVSDIIISIPYRRASNRADGDPKKRLTNRQTQNNSTSEMIQYNVT